MRSICFMPRCFTDRSEIHALDVKDAIDPALLSGDVIITSAAPA